MEAVEIGISGIQNLGPYVRNLVTSDYILYSAEKVIILLDSFLFVYLLFAILKRLCPPQMLKFCVSKWESGGKSRADPEFRNEETCLCKLFVFFGVFN